METLRRLFTALGVAVALGLLAACATATPAAPQPTTVASQPTTSSVTAKPFAGKTLVAWNTAGPDFFWGDSAQTTLKQFEDATGATVEWDNFGAQWEDKVAAALSTGSTNVDLVFTWATDTATWARAGWLEDVGSRYTPEMKQDLLTESMQAVTYQGKIYGVPQFLSIQTGYYNTKLFQDAGLDPNKPPSTFEELIDDAKKLTKKPDQYGFSVSWGDKGNLFMSFAQWTQLAGGTILDDTGKPVFNSPAGKKALQAMADGMRDGWIDPGSISYNDTFIALQPFETGKVAMEFHWPAAWARVNDPKESKVVGQVKMFLVPGFTGGPRSISLDGSMGWNMSKYSLNKDLGWEFMKWAASTPIQKEQVLKTGWLPVTKSAFDDPEVLSSSPAIPAYKAQVEYVGNRYGSPYYNEMANAMAPYLMDAINGKISVDDGLANAEKAAQGVFAKYQQ
jgi:multiple sugar transport system substrate-binding protein